MSEGLYRVVDAINAIGYAAALADTKISQLLADAAGLPTVTEAINAVNAAASTSTIEGGTGGGGGMSATAGPEGGPNSTGGVGGGGGPGFGKTTVEPLGAGQVIADLKSLKGR